VSSLKNFISQDNLQNQNLLDSGWSSGDKISTGPPLQLFCTIKKLLGLAKDYKKVLLKCKHEMNKTEINKLLNLK